MPNDRARTPADWLEPSIEEEGLAHYIETIRQRIGIVLLAVAVTTAFAIAYVLTAPKTYEAVADVQITPISDSDSALQGLGLIGTSSDPTRDVETASRLITNTEVADRVTEDLGISGSGRDLLGQVEATPVAQSNIVAVTAEAGTPEEAQELANSFVEQALAVRLDEFQEVLRTRITNVAGSVAPGDSTQAPLLAALRSYVGSPDPTIKAGTAADLPDSPASPRPVLSTIGGLFSGLILGIAAAFAAQSLDPRLRREEQLRRRYRLPILARIPKEPARTRHPLGPRAVSTATAEAYRTLRATLPSRDQAGGRVILVTGSSASEGKTTSAVNLASSLALAGNKVIIVEADLRRPALGEALDIDLIRGGVVGVLIENLRLEDALTPTPTYGNKLRALVADYEGGWIAELFTIPAAAEMIAEARRIADYVVIDSPPLNEVVDALPLAQLADDVLIVVRLGKTRLDNISELGELLAESGVRPAGFAVIGVPQPSRGEYHYYRYSSNGSDAEGASQLLPGQAPGG